MERMEQVMSAYVEPRLSDRDLLAQTSAQLIEASRQIAIRDARIRDLERQVAQLMCWGLVPFAHDELDFERAAAFREHLGSCDLCRAGLVEIIQVGAQLSTMKERSDG